MGSTDKEQANEAKRRAAAERIWGSPATTETPGPAPTEQALWDSWAENAKAHADANRSYYVAQVSLTHTAARYTSGHAEATTTTDPAWVIQAIESAGWTLFDVGYVYQTVRERSHMLTDSAQIEGNIIGVYTFRRSVPPPPPI
jgi:hypothetical protein